MKPLKLIFLGFLLLIAGELLAQNIYVYPQQTLEFGNFTAPDSGGSVTVSNSGERSSSGAVQLLNSEYHPAIFEISTDSTTPLEVFIEVTKEVLVNAEGTAILMASVPRIENTYTIQAGKPVQVRVGGTLKMKSGISSSGEFQGNISITVIPNND